MLNPTSVDIETLSAEVTWDISGTLPQISIVNTSTGSGLDNVNWWFVATSPSNSYIHEGSVDSPDIEGDWTTHVLSDSWPRPYNNIEFSAAPYVLTMYAQDSNGNIYSVEYSVSICRPFGNTEKSTNPYGLASTEVNIKCDQGRVYFRNITNVSYQGLTGTMNASSLRVIYPIDETLVVPEPFVISPFGTALVPISYSSDNYQFVAQQFYTYDFGGGSFVKIQYRQLKRFAVYCNIDLSPLVCEWQKLIDEIENGSCSDVAKANEQLMLINSKFALVMMGIQQPLTGVDVPTLITEIEAIGGFSCNCCAAPTGIIPTTSSVIDGYNFTVNALGGDVDGTFEKVGSNIVLNLSDKSYVFQIGASTLSETDAFSVSSTTSGDGYTKTYYLNVDLPTLATDLATTISENGTVLNLWQTVLGIGGETSIIVDGGCIFQSSSVCDYYFTLSNIPASGTYATFTSVSVGNVPVTKNYAFNQTNLSGLQSYLNAMGLGTWVVTDLGGNSVQLKTLSNSNNLSGVTYSIAGTTYNADFTRECTGYVPITLNEFAAYIVNYLCALSDAQVYTSVAYEVCYIDNLGLKQIEAFDAGVALTDVLASIAARGCQVVDYVKSLNAVTCDSIKTVFPTNSSLVITGQDFVFGTKGAGVCSRVPYLDILRYGLNAAKSDAYTLNLLCEAVTMCGAGLACAPFGYYEIIVTDYDTNCTTATGIEYTLS